MKASETIERYEAYCPRELSMVLRHYNVITKPDYHLLSFAIIYYHLSGFFPVWR